MNMFGLEGSGFIIAVGLTFLLAGLIIYYVNAKMVSLEKAIIQQNGVLGNFINGIKQEINMNGASVGSLGGGAGEAGAGEAGAGEAGAGEAGAGEAGTGSISKPVIHNNLATTEALEAAQDFVNKPQNLIEVSEESDSDTDSDTESDTDSDTESVINLEENDKIELVIKNEVDQEDNAVKIIELNDLDTKHISSSDSEYEYEMEEVEIIENITNNEEESNIKEDILIDLKSLKVNELRKLVVSKKFKTATVAKALKKEELIELLTNE